MTEEAPNNSEAPEKKRSYKKRSAAGLSVDEAHRTGASTGDDRDPNSEIKRSRVRIPMNSGQQLSLRGYELDWDKYHYKWVHEHPARPGQLEGYKGAFYEHCAIEGEPLKTPSGGGFDYLMRLPIQYYNEDLQAAREKREAMRKSSTAVKEGEYTTDSQGRPVEGGSVQATRKVSNNPYS